MQVLHSEITDLKEQLAQRPTATSPQGGQPDQVAILLKQGNKGFGMEISDNGHIVACADGQPAALANVPVPSRIVSVGGREVTSKADVVVALKGIQENGVEFVFRKESSDLVARISELETELGNANERLIQQQRQHAEYGSSPRSPASGDMHRQLQEALEELENESNRASALQLQLQQALAQVETAADENKQAKARILDIKRVMFDKHLELVEAQNALKASKQELNTSTSDGSSKRSAMTTSVGMMLSKMNGVEKVNNDKQTSGGSALTSSFDLFEF